MANTSDEVPLAHTVELSQTKLYELYIATPLSGSGESYCILRTGIARKSIRPCATANQGNPGGPGRTFSDQLSATTYTVMFHGRGPAVRMLLGDGKGAPSARLHRQNRRADVMEYFSVGQ